MGILNYVDYAQKKVEGRPKEMLGKALRELNRTRDILGNMLTFARPGAGMTEDVRQRIFDPFFTTKPRGTGTGLSVSHNIVTGFGGDIVCEREPDAGSVFRVSLPRWEKAPGERT